MAYFPNNFAHDRKGEQEAVIRVIYSRPQKSGREIFGNLVPWKKVWRAGANEATEIKFYKDVEIGGKKVKAGTYSLFAIPDEKLNIRIDTVQDENRVFISTLTGTKRELTAGYLLWYAIRFPFIPLRIISLIHWNAFLLWLKKIPFHKKSANAELQRDVFRKE